MAVGSNIEWTQATWNPSTGCTKVSPGCKNCYAERLTKRLTAMGQKKYKRGFEYVEHEDDLDLPISWKRPRRIFVNSMSDLFHEQSTFEFAARCFDTMLRADWHDYQILTKRPGKMAEFSGLFKEYYGGVVPNHIWMGTSIESREFVPRIKELRRVKCRTRFISFEPLIGPVGKVNLKGIDWVIIGGESGPNFRPVKQRWIEELISQCKDQDVAVFFKQWGGHRPKSGGRTINGKTYGEYPTIKKRNPLRDMKLDRVRFAELCLKNEASKIKVSAR